jgi:hypothetical protein
VLATGYRPDLAYLQPLGALDPNGLPRQRSGVSTTHPGLAYVGLDWQRSASSATLRGVGRDATHVARRLVAGFQYGGNGRRCGRQAGTGAATSRRADRAASLPRTGR